MEKEIIRRNTFMQTFMKNIWKLKLQIKNIFFSVWWGVIGDKELDFAINEGTFAFHTVAHNQSFQLMGSTMKIIRILFEPKFTCA
jgi:hypothetical protein